MQNNQEKITEVLKKANEEFLALASFAKHNESVNTPSSEKVYRQLAEETMEVLRIVYENY